MTTQKGKIGVIHGIEVKGRDQVHEPKVENLMTSEDGRTAVLRAAQIVYERHRNVIQALANR